MKLGPESFAVLMYKVGYMHVVLAYFDVVFFQERTGLRNLGTADSRRHDPPFSETGSWKLEVGSWISQLCALVEKKTRRSWYGKGSWYKVG